MESWMKVEIEDETVLVVKWERVLKETKKREVNRIWIHVCLFRLLDICVTILIVIFMFQ